MPDLVGRDLQSAQDAIQRVTGNPLFVTRSKDASGRGRTQVLDRNWTVCAQDVVAGQRFTSSTTITFSVVKDDENCP